MGVVVILDGTPEQNGTLEQDEFDKAFSAALDAFFDRARTGAAAQVTAAIGKAEALPQGSIEAQKAYRVVWRLEMVLAKLTKASTIEGEVARLGAVTAAVKAGEGPQAVELAQMFLEDPLLREEIRAEIRKAMPIGGEGMPGEAPSSTSS